MCGVYRILTNPSTWLARQAVSSVPGVAHALLRQAAVRVHVTCRPVALCSRDARQHEKSTVEVYENTPLHGTYVRGIGRSH
jgi:hypothetical protein